MKELKTKELTEVNGGIVLEFIPMIPVAVLGAAALAPALAVGKISAVGATGATLGTKFGEWVCSQLELSNQV